MGNEAYVLITAARNEERHIGKTLASVAAQTHRPKAWIVVSDGSTDRTDELVLEYAARHDFIHLLKLGAHRSRNFSSQAYACNVGYDAVKQRDFGFVGFLDADISFAPSYYEEVLAAFQADPFLGVAGGDVLEGLSGRPKARFGNSIGNVAGAVQFFRRRCFEDIGAHLKAMPYGGHDFVANAMARMNGWDLRTIAHLSVIHHRPTGSEGASRWQAMLREGKADYSTGYHALFEIGKCIRRMRERPFVIGGVARLCGYFTAWIARERMRLPEEVVRFVRGEQLCRMLRRTSNAGRESSHE